MWIWGNTNPKSLTDTWLKPLISNTESCFPWRVSRAVLLRHFPAFKTSFGVCEWGVGVVRTQLVVQAGGGIATLRMHSNHGLWTSKLSSGLKTSGLLAPRRKRLLVAPYSGCPTSTKQRLKLFLKSGLSSTSIFLSCAVLIPQSLVEHGNFAQLIKGLLGRLNPATQMVFWPHHLLPRKPLPLFGWE